MVEKMLENKIYQEMLDELATSDDGELFCFFNLLLKLTIEEDTRW